MHIISCYHIEFLFYDLVSLTYLFFFLGNIMAKILSFFFLCLFGWFHWLKPAENSIIWEQTQTEKSVILIL